MQRLSLIVPFLALICSCNPSSSLPERELVDLLQQHLVLLADDAFDALARDLADHEIVFLGERHDHRSMYQAACLMAVHLARFKPVVFACESNYGNHSFLEALSMGHPRGGMRWDEASLLIADYNHDRPEREKILVTAVDIEHAIRNSKGQVAAVLHDLFSRATRDDAKSELGRQIRSLPQQDTYEKMDTYLSRITREFRRYRDAFSAEDQEEIDFYLELLLASNRYQHAVFGRPEIEGNPDEIRHEYFIKTIERALAKAREREGILLCRVGGWHVGLHERTEARHFAKRDPQTRGRVSAIRMVPIDERGHRNPRGREPQNLNAVVRSIMRDASYAYLPLHALTNHTSSAHLPSEYYTKQGVPKYDGLLFVKTWESDQRSGPESPH